MVMSTTTRWVTSVGVAIAIAAPMVGAQSRKPRVVIVATGGTIAGAAESTTAAGYKSGAVAVDVLIAAVPQMKSFADVTGRSEERRVGKEWGSGCSADRLKQSGW